MEKIEALTEAVLAKVLIPLEASGRHVHLTQEQAEHLFGHGLTKVRPLSQPGQYLCQERVTVKGPEGEFRNVAVLGPVRSKTQVEISLTDGKLLGIRPPIRLSGDIKGSPGCCLIGSKGAIELKEGVIVAQRHVHLTPADGVRFGVRDRQVVKLETFTDRGVVFQDVIVRIAPDFATAAHLDYDEANACGFRKGDWGRIVE